MRRASPASKTWGATYGPYLTLGLQLSLTVIVFFFLGKWLDGALGTAPWLMLSGIFVGIVGGMIRFLKSAVALGKKEDLQWKKDRHKEGDHPEGTST
jgi:F0F1-type ATP synthase assembly protein I